MAVFQQFFSNVDVVNKEINRKILALPDKVKVSIYASGIMLALLAIIPIVIDMTKSLSAFR